jgi:uncharacterized Zn-binding protein involved in type VI secretion
MAGMPAARKDDPHVCPLPGHHGGPILPPCCKTVLIGGEPAARIGDMCHCDGSIDLIRTGSATVVIGYREAARKGDKTDKGSITKGCPTVLIGDQGEGEGENKCLVLAAREGLPYVGGVSGLA